VALACPILNYLVISIEPAEGIMLQFNAKVPGPTIFHQWRRNEIPLQGLLQGGAEQRL